MYLFIYSSTIHLSIYLSRIGDFTIEKYAEQVSNLGMDKFSEYSTYGKNTFFIPIDQAFEVSFSTFAFLKNI